MNSMKPILIEPNVRNFLSDALYHSYLYRVKWNTFALNFFLGALIISSIVLYLLYKYKNRPSKNEMERREREKLQKTLATIKQHQMNKMREQQGIISGLPNWKNEYESIIQASPFYR